MSLSYTGLRDYIRCEIRDAKAAGLTEQAARARRQQRANEAAAFIRDRAKRSAA